MTFLPKKYTLPEQESNYCRLEEGDNIFRVLSSAITGWEWWIDDPENKGKRKPMRVKDQADVPADFGQDTKHFWAFIVYNRNKEQVQILELTQRTIMTAIERLVANEKWGDPKEYDLNVSRTGKELDTSYTTMPEPKEELDPGVVRMYKDMNINLSALFEGKDPFKSEDDVSDVPGDLK